MPDLLSLPEELLSKISDFVHPQNLIDWACTSNILSRCSLRPLEKYRQRRSDLRVVHDRNPITIPSLLRSGLSEPEILWYVRSLDIWDLRENFEEWKSSRFGKWNPIWVYESDEFLDWPEKHHDYSHLDTTFYADEELERYRNILSDLLHLKEPLVDKWMERLRTGSDEPPKVLLMAMSPRLKKATFVEYDCWQSGGKSHPFRLLASTLRTLAPLPGPLWPCFQNLKTVFVGHYTELRHPHDTYYPHSRVVAPMFLLPALEELHLGLVMGEENDPESDLENDDEDGENPKPYVWEWETARSSCQKLTYMSTYVPDQLVYTADNGIDMEKSAFGTTNWVDLSTFLPPTLQTLKIYEIRLKLFSYQIEGLVHHLVALVRAKKTPPNGPFASLTEICLVTLSVKSTQSRRCGPEPYGLDPWLGDLKQLCEEANVKIHTQGRMTSAEGPFGESYPCSSCRIGEVDSLDSALVIP